MRLEQHLEYFRRVMNKFEDESVDSEAQSKFPFISYSIIPSQFLGFRCGLICSIDYSMNGVIFWFFFAIYKWLALLLILVLGTSWTKTLKRK